MTSLIRDLASSTPEMLDIFGDRYTLEAACQFEAALARACAAEGLITESEAASIAECCVKADWNVREIADEAANAGTLAIALVAELRSRIAQQNPQAAAKLHLGATSQDVADSVLMLQVRDAATIIERDLLHLSDALERLTQLPFGQRAGRDYDGRYK